MIYANAPMFHNPTGWLEGAFVAQPNGYVTVERADGRVLSVQPDGRFESRDAGTAGPYELAQQASDKLIYRSGGSIFVVLTVG